MDGCRIVTRTGHRDRQHGRRNRRWRILRRHKRVKHGPCLSRGGTIHQQAGHLRVRTQRQRGFCFHIQSHALVGIRLHRPVERGGAILCRSSSSHHNTGGEHHQTVANCLHEQNLVPDLRAVKWPAQNSICFGIAPGDFDGDVNLSHNFRHYVESSCNHRQQRFRQKSFG